MKKEIWIGLGAIACAGAIVGGVMIKNNDFNFIKDHEEEDYSDKIEALWKDELKDKNKYSFCLGEMEINSNHADSALGFYGKINYTSKEVSVYDKEKDKIYIMSRQSDYSYDGVIKQMLGGTMKLDVPVTERGKLAETYTKNEMPIRLDYSNNFITSDPDVKNKQWAVVTIGEDVSSGMPHHGCAGTYSLDNKVGADMLVGGQQVIISRECNEGLMGAKYDGSFEYQCNEISYDQAMEMLDKSKTTEQLQNSKNKEVFENDEGRDIEDAVGDANTTVTTLTSDDLKKAIEEMKKEMEIQANQREN